MFLTRGDRRLLSTSGDYSNSVFFLILVVFLVVPLAELYVFTQVVGSIGFFETVAIMILVSVTGAWLARHEGFVVLARIRSALSEGRMPGDEMIDGALVLVGGLLLLTPGFLTDAAGILFLFPLTRLPVRVLLRRRFGQNLEHGPGTSFDENGAMDI